MERGINSPSVVALSELAKALGIKASELVRDIDE